MAFESLTKKLQNVLNSLRSKGRLNENDVNEAMREVRAALLEADVNYSVVKDFIAKVKNRAIGSEVLESLTPGQQVIKIVNEELISLMGNQAVEITLNSDRTIIMMAGLQGAGKTTTAAKLTGKFKEKGYTPLLVACDIYRPAAIDQLRINAEKQNVELFEEGTEKKVYQIVLDAIEYAGTKSLNPVIIDTAGRTHIDDDMMDELKSIKDKVNIDYTILTIDAMTGQDAVNVASEFNEKVGIDGVILTKLDGDMRGGAALSVRAVTGKPIFYAGMGEKLSDLEVFHPDRMADRILGMGDVLTLIEKAEAELDEKKAEEMLRKMQNSEFDYNDFLDQISQIKSLGGVGSILGMMPGMGNINTDKLDDRQFDRIEAMIRSMTPEERANPSIINNSRKSRIAKGAGVSMIEVNKLIKQFDQTKKMQKQLSGLMGKGLGNLSGLGDLSKLANLGKIGNAGKMGKMFGKMKF